MDDEKLLEMLTDIRLSCAQTSATIVSVQKMLDQHELRIGKLESTGPTMRQDIIMFAIKIIGWLILIIASLVGAGPLIQGFAK